MCLGVRAFISCLLEFGSGALISLFTIVKISTSSE